MARIEWSSWWTGARPRSAPEVVLRHALYFGVPMAVLTFGAVSVWSHQNPSYVEHMYRAQKLDVQGRAADAAQEARLAFSAMQQQLPYARRLAELQPTSSREAELAFLVYNHSRYAHLVIPALDGRDAGVNEAAVYRAGVEEAMRILQRAAARGGSLGHPGREAMTVDDTRRVLESWKRTADRLQQVSEAVLPP